MTMKLKFVRNALYTDSEGKSTEIPAGATVDVPNEEIAKGYVERGTAVDPSADKDEDDATQAYLDAQQPTRVDQATVNSGQAAEPAVVPNPAVSTGPTPEELANLN